jgi:TP901 family phage tail tape measure protein
MADYNLGTAKGKIELDASGAVTGAAQANAAIKSIDTTSGKSAQGTRQLGTAMAATGAVAVGAFGLAVKAAADFEKQMSGIKAVSNASEKQMDDLRKKALQLGADTAFGAGEAAGAMEELIKAGLSVDDVMNGAADATVALAAAGEVDLATAATIASNAMNQFGLSAQEMPRVADLIAGAANASAIDVNDFGMSLAQAGATANLIGLSFDDLALAITAMGNAGIKGSDAGTSLKTFMSNLQPTTEKQKELFDQLGLSIEANATAMNETGNAFFDGAGKIKPMEEIAGTLATALEGMSDAQKTATLEALFGSDAIRAAAIIAGEGAAGFQELAGAMNEVTAAEVAEARLDNLMGSVEKLKGSFETLLITAGTPFLDFIRGIVDHATNAVNWLAELDAQTLKYVTAGLAIAGAVLAISGALVVLSTTMGPVVKGLAALRVIIATIAAIAAANPLGLLVIAIAAVAAGLAWLYTNNEGFRNFVDGMVDKIIEFGEAVREWFLNTALPAIQQFWQDVQPILQALGEFFMNVIVPAIVDFWGVVQPILQAFADFFTGTILPAVQSFISFITDTLVPGVISGFQAIQDAVGPIIDWLSTNVFATFYELGNAIFVAFLRIVDFMNATLVPAFQTAWTIISGVVETAINVMRPIIETFIGVITSAWQLFGDNLLTAFSIAWNAIKTVVETVLGVIRGIAQVFTGIFTGDMDKFLEGLRTLWDTVWNAIKGILETVWNTMKLVVENAVDAIRLVIENTWNVIKGIFEAVWNGIKGAWDTVWNVIKDKVQTVTDTVKSIVSSAWSAVEGFFRTTIGVIRGIWNTLWDFVENTVSTAVDAVTLVIGVAGATWGTLFNTAKSLITGPINAIKAVIDGIASAVRGAIGAIDDLIGAIGRIPSPGSIVDAVTPWDGLLPGATGGIFNRPTAMLIGEAGSEALIPLTDTARALDLMRQSGLDQLVMKTYGMGQGGYPVGVPAAAPSGGGGSGIEVHGDLIIRDSVDWEMLMMQADSQMAAMA